MADSMGRYATPIETRPREDYQEDGKWTIWDGNLKLDTVDTEEQAVRVIHRWENRDELSSEIEYFINEMVTKYTQKNGSLEEEEVRLMIKEY